MGGTYSLASSGSDQRGSWSPLEGSAVLSSYLTHTHTRTHTMQYSVSKQTHLSTFPVWKCLEFSLEVIWRSSSACGYLVMAWRTTLTVLWQGHAEHRLLLVFQVRHHLSQSAQPLVDFFHLQNTRTALIAAFSGQVCWWTVTESESVINIYNYRQPLNYPLWPKCCFDPTK